MYDLGENDEGAAFVYHGSSSGLNPTANSTLEGNSIGANFGYSVSTAGDVNGDGYSDVIIGAHRYTNTESEEGAAFLYSGSSTGLIATPSWSAESNQADSRFGTSVSTAGDVNGDGFSDVILGARLHDNGESNEGTAFIYHGSSSGLNPTANWTGEGNQAEAQFGFSVSTAGDVNGDGYSDVIIGAVLYANGETGEGRAYVYKGSALGLNSTPIWTSESNQINARFGYSVSSAGDVNGDGYSDLIIGAPFYANGQTAEGKTFVYLGSASGISATADWTAESNVASAQFGYSVSTVGDVNGDGYSDVIIGANEFTNIQANEGKTFAYYGNSSKGMRSNLQQYQYSTSNLIGPHGKVSSDGQIRFGQFAKSPFGRTKGKLVYEYAATGSAFSSGDSITNSVSYTGNQSSFTNLGLTGTELTEDISGIPTYKNYRFRTRVKYDMVSNPYQVYGPWKYYESYQPLSFGSFKSQTSPLPVELTSFTAKIIEKKIVLNWLTATEVNNYGFEVQRSVVSLPTVVGDQRSEEGWDNIGFVEGHGNSNSLKSYSFTDKTMQYGKCSFRLKQIDFDGKFEYSDEIEIEVNMLPTEFALFQNYPNPFNPSTTIKYNLPVDSKVVMEIYNVLGEKVMTLINQEIKAGFNEVNFNASYLSSGIYIYRISAGEFNQVKKMMLLK